MTTVTMPTDLYDCYVLFMKESKKAILSLISTQAGRNFFSKTQKPMSRAAFNRAWAKMTLKKRKEFERELRIPYKERIEKEKRLATQAREEYETNPKVRERVKKRVRRAMKRALTPKK